MTKASFDGIYVAPDPRAYYEVLGSLDYQVPEHGCAIFHPLIEALAERSGRDTVRVVDLCCSYGVNATLLKYDVDWSDVVDHYRTSAIDDLEREALVRRDREWFGSRRRDRRVEVVGIDASASAIGYALDAGLLDAGLAADLERDPIPAEFRAELEGADLVTVTGGIGYIGARTVGRVLDAVGGSPWLAVLCLRWVDFAPVAAAATIRGLVTEHLPDVTCRQRRFADEEERRFALAELQRRGVDPDGHEDDGYHHTDVFVARPIADYDEDPLADLLGVAAR